MFLRVSYPVPSKMDEEVENQVLLPCFCPIPAMFLPHSCPIGIPHLIKMSNLVPKPKISATLFSM